jgi:hypothetical protein
VVVVVEELDAVLDVEDVELAVELVEELDAVLDVEDAVLEVVVELEVVVVEAWKKSRWK